MLSKFERQHALYGHDEHLRMAQVPDVALGLTTNSYGQSQRLRGVSALNNSTPPHHLLSDVARLSEAANIDTVATNTGCTAGYAHDGRSVRPDGYVANKGPRL
jgi:hypothetical protein